MTLTEPGLYEIPELEYHADPVSAGSFSSTMAKQILKSPATLRHYLDSPRVEKAAYDFGHVVHGGVLGVGLEVEILDFPDWRTKAAKEAKLEVYARGAVPMLEREYAPAKAAIEAVKAHPLAGPLFANPDGLPERSAFAKDPGTDLWLRGRFDWITPNHTLVDLKTTVNGEPHQWEREGRRLGYDLQSAFYTHVYEQATGNKPTGFMFITVEKEAPHLVDVHQPPDWPEIGEAKLHRALAAWKLAKDTDEWPGRPPEINNVFSPEWALEEEEIVI